MAAFASAAFSTSAFSALAFSFDSIVVAPAIRGTDGYHGHDELGRLHREREKVERSAELRAAEQVIADVAARQAADYRLDDAQRQQELQGELRIRGIEMRSAHLEALSAQREKIIRDELQALFRKRQDDEDIAVLFLLAGSA